MRTTHHTAILLGTAAALAACDPPPEPPPTVSASFDVTATLSSTDDPLGGVTIPYSMQFSVSLQDDSDKTVDVIWSSERGLDQVTFDRVDAELVQVEALDFLVGLSTEDTDSEARIVLESLRLALVDGDGDGNADTFTGSGTGSLYYVVGDVIDEYEFTVEVRGDPDVTPPELQVVNDGAVHVLDGLWIRASEPLQHGTVVRAFHGDTAIPLAPVPSIEEGYVWFFGTDAMLPFGADLRLEVEPAPRDLAGNVATSLPELTRTMPGPDTPFVEDGFEGDALAVVGGASVVTGVGTLPALSGARSLLLVPGDTLTTSIPLTEGDTHLRLRGRLLFESEATSGCPGFALRAGATGNNGRQSLLPLWSYEPVEATGDATWGVATPVIDLEMPLPANASGELVLDVYDLAAVLTRCPAVAMLIDDLRVE
jgi:hypothetical protein